MNWIFITAGVGSKDFEEAAERLGNQVAGFNLFSEIRVFKTSDVGKYCPELEIWYPGQNLGLIKGYGWYVWKSRFAKVALAESAGADGVMYLDAGCESSPNIFSKKKLEEMMSVAQESGACVFRVPTPEIFFTKKSVLERFNLNPVDLDVYQFQSGSWLFSKEVGDRFISDWDSIVWEDKSFCDESESFGGEFSDFKVNRYDQSIFSPLVRKYGFTAYKQMPPGDISRFRSRIRFFFFPFAWARNRTGVSLVSSLELTLSSLTLKLFR
jgi:hypothetical protein